jgi:hypothetical protein
MNTIRDCITDGNRLSLHAEFGRRTNWKMILEPHGWQLSEVNGDTIYWRAPGDRASERSAMNGGGGDDLHVFYGDGCHPFIRGMTYSKWQAHCVLNFDCDEKAAEIHFSGGSNMAGIS